jgi:acyl-CoA reductase-like NAD-dependent aldehyde dehydrogenase
MNKINNIHDTFFRETMNHQEVVANFLANSLPDKMYIKPEISWRKVMDAHVTSQFQKAIFAVESLPLDDREDLLDILRRRLAENRREQIAANARETRKAVRAGKASFGTLDDLKRELRSSDV